MRRFPHAHPARRVGVIGTLAGLLAVALSFTGSGSADAAPAPAMGNLLVFGDMGVTLTGLASLPAAGVIVTRSGPITTITSLEEFAAPSFQPSGSCIFGGGGVICTTSSPSVIADFHSTSQGVELDLQAGSTLTATFTGGSGNDSFYGAAGADSAQGGLGNDDLFGGPGPDILSGDAGNDYVEGEEGNDRLSAGTGNDVLVSAEDVPEKDDLVECGDASGLDRLDIDPALDITKNCQGVGVPSVPAPNGVTATGTVNSDGNAIVNAVWSPGVGAAAYQVDYSKDSGISWISLTRTRDPRLTGWNAGTLRGSIVMRISSVSSSAVSSGVLSNVFVLGDKPNEPSDVAAQGWAEVNALESGFMLTWKSATSPTSYDVQYQLCTGDASAVCGSWTKSTASGQSRSADFTVPEPGLYNVRIRSVGSTGLTSDWVTTTASAPTGPVTAVNNVNAWGSASNFMVLWQSSSLASKWLKGYRIQMQIISPNGGGSPWTDVLTTTGTRTAYKLSTKSLGTKAGDIVRFRVYTIPVYGAASRSSDPSPRRQQTDDVPVPTDFAATYDSATDWMTMTWKAPSTSLSGGLNVGGYQFSYLWPNTNSWTDFGTPISDGDTSAVYDLGNVPRGTLRVRIRSISWPDMLYSEWTAIKSVRK